jgi:tetratricopeptide (TPR) repeat protein
MEEQVKLEKELASLDELVQNRKIDEAIKLIDSQFSKFPMFGEELAMAKFQILLMVGRDPDKAFAWAKEAAETHLAKNADALNQIAWAILEGDMMPKKDLDLALSLAEKAVKLDPEEPSGLDTLARAHFARKDLAKAVETQKKALELAKKKKADDEAIEELTERLKEYETALAEKK